MKKPNLDQGYIRKPKPIPGFKLETYYCECGCKKSYWHYVKKGRVVG